MRRIVGIVTSIAAYGFLRTGFAGEARIWPGNFSRWTGFVPSRAQYDVNLNTLEISLYIVLGTLSLVVWVRCWIGEWKEYKAKYGIERFHRE
jgi:hypothetical protein